VLAGLAINGSENYETYFAGNAVVGAVLGLLFPIVWRLLDTRAAVAESSQHNNTESMFAGEESTAKPRAASEGTPLLTASINADFPAE
jgi:hypothetical protein